MSKPIGRFFFQILWPSQKTSTLEKALGHMINNCDDEKMMQNAKCLSSLRQKVWEIYSNTSCLIRKCIPWQIWVLPSLFGTMHTESFDWCPVYLEWIINLEFSSLKLLIFYQKLLWNIRCRLNSSTLWVFRPVLDMFDPNWSIFAQKMILIKYI